MALNRRGHLGARCPRCRMHVSVCVCALIPALQTRTRLVLVMHRAEERKTTNTGRLAALCLPNSELITRGSSAGEPSVELPANTQPLLVFPDDDATPLREWAACERPITLVVPDGTWRQAAKVRKRMPALAGVPCVSLPGSDGSRYRLRRGGPAGGLSTMEAIACAMGILEGAAVENALLSLFHAMVDRTLWTRGQLPDAAVRGGLPPGASRDGVKK